VNRAVETAGTVTFAERYTDREGGHLLLHSRRRSDAVVLDALIATDPTNDLIPKLVQGLLGHRVRGRWEGTQENAWALLALDRYFRTYEAATPDFHGGVWLGDRYAGGTTFRGRTTEREHVAVPMPQLLRADARDLLIARDGTGRLYYRAGLRYAPADLRPAALNRGFIVSRTYEAVDDAGDVRRAADGSWQVRAGARVRVRVTMIAPSVRHHVALVDALPAGFELINPSLAGGGFADDPGLIPVDGPGVRGMMEPGMVRSPAAPAGRPIWPWPQSWYSHENLRDDRAEAFAPLLPAGVHDYTYLARATTPGAFIVPPPRAEMMYEPETFGRGAGDRVVIRSGQ
jgi:alpha-2-macroglobulin